MTTIKGTLKAIKKQIGLKVFCGCLCSDIFFNALHKLIMYFGLGEIDYLIAAIPFLIIWIFIANKYLLKPMPTMPSKKKVRKI